MAPAAVAIASWGVVTGVAMVKAGMPLPLLLAGAPLPVVLVTAAIVNLRFVIFSAAARPFFEHLPLRQRALLNYLNGDLPFALFMGTVGGDTARGTPQQLGTYLGIAFTNWGSWQAASVAGFLLGGVVPTSWGLGLAAVLALLGVVIPMSRTRPALAGVLVSGVVAVVLVRMPMKLGLLAAVFAGVAVSLVLERVTEGPS
jgi:predicted branched-subunit amino acid permease